MLNEVPVAVLQKVLKRKTSSRESGTYLPQYPPFHDHSIQGHEVAATVGDAIAKLKVGS